jgi:hypothetical protein
MKTGSLTYTPRARRQDSAQAMDNDLMNALVELITNSDDAYIRASDHTSPIYVACDQSRLYVIDEAGGLPYNKMVECFTEEGIDTHSDGVTTRGLFGRGAKDCAVFGSVTFVSKHESGNSWIKIENSKFEADTGFPGLTGMPNASKLMRSTGLMAIVSVKSVSDNPTLATANKMVVSYPIRKILERRQVYFSNKTFSPNFRLISPVTFDAPLFTRDSILQRTNLTASLCVRRRPETKSAFKAFVEIGSNLHALAMERFDLPTSELKEYHVEVQISDLEIYLQKIDQQFESKSPVVKRDRSGLTPDTAFFTDLKSFVEGAFNDFLTEEQKRKRSEATDTINRQLTNIAAKLADEFSSDLEEVDSESEQEKLGFPSFNPPYIKLEVGTTKVVSLRHDKLTSLSEIQPQHGSCVDVTTATSGPDQAESSFLFDVTITGLRVGSERVAIPLHGQTGVLRVDVAQHVAQPEQILELGFNPSRISTHRNTTKTSWYLPDNQEIPVTFAVSLPCVMLEVSTHNKQSHGLCYKVTITSSEIGEFEVFSSEGKQLRFSVIADAMNIKNLSVELIEGDSTRGYLATNEEGRRTVRIYADHPALRLSGFSEAAFYDGIPSDKPAFQCMRDTIVNIVIDYLLIRRCKADTELLVDYESVQMEREMLYKKYVRLLG